MKTRLLIIGLGAVVLTGCATNQGLLTPQTGIAIEQAYAKQIVDPNAKKGAPSINPEKAAAAIDRYLKDQVKDPSPEENTFIIE